MKNYSKKQITEAIRYWQAQLDESQSADISSLLQKARQLVHKHRMAQYSTDVALMMLVLIVALVGKAGATQSIQRTLDTWRSDKSNEDFTRLITEVGSEVEDLLKS